MESKTETKNLSLSLHTKESGDLFSNLLFYLNSTFCVFISKGYCSSSRPNTAGLCIPFVSCPDVFVSMFSRKDAGRYTLDTSFWVHLLEAAQQPAPGMVKAQLLCSSRRECSWAGQALDRDTTCPVSATDCVCIWELLDQWRRLGA